MNNDHGKTLSTFLVELIGVWIVIVLVVLLINVLHSHYSEGHNLREVTNFESLLNRVQSILIYITVLAGAVSIGVRSKSEYSWHSWLAAFLLGFIFGFVIYGLYVYSEVHTLSNKALPQILLIVLIPGGLLGGLCGGMTAFCGLAANKLIKLFQKQDSSKLID